MVNLLSKGVIKGHQILSLLIDVYRLPRQPPQLIRWRALVIRIGNLSALRHTKNPIYLLTIRNLQPNDNKKIKRES
ncbi:unnamed protein product [Leptidea sinapis]|uniref:Uncharacterized protein n=1 Tax=Leptidea sinapis TaxID=189913 RepID=A0A5E4Q2V8_9NEOP|nr:unnamed protein product [Leptidea sinapis]